MWFLWYSSFLVPLYLLEPINKYQGTTVYVSAQLCLFHAYGMPFILEIWQAPFGLTFWEAVKIRLFFWDSIGWSWSWKIVIWVVSREFGFGARFFCFHCFIIICMMWSLYYGYEPPKILVLRLVAIQIF